MKKLILIVEDEYEVSEAIASILEDEGYGVASCADGIEAQNYLKDHVPSLIISDVMMPRCDGYALLKFIRGNKSLNRVPVILMSAAIPKKPDTGCDRFMKKPFSLDTLLDNVESAIKCSQR